MHGDKFKYLIIGAGPTGLGAAHRLKELGVNDFAVLEGQTYPGGLSASFKDQHGFTWDIGGHVVFSHYAYFDRLVEEALAGEYLEHVRISRIRKAGTWTPYPFQNNIRHLPTEMQWDCVYGLLPDKRPTGSPANFHEWIACVFGAGLGRHFMYPYNFKVWATPLELMDYRWIGERVSLVSLESVLENLILQRDDSAWGPNSIFRFPKQGGTGAIYQAIAHKLAGHIRYADAAVVIDPEAKLVRTESGAVYAYERLLNTGPLDLLVHNLLRPAETAIQAAASQLEHNGVFVTGLGVADFRADATCWMYFPDNDCPFYRVTNFHNYSPDNVPDCRAMRGLMCETSYSKYKQENLHGLSRASATGLVNTGLLSQAAAESRIRSTWEFDAAYGYPVPTLGRDAALRALHDWLRPRGIYSRGRFGGWKYEVANMDHSVMQGVEWAEMIVTGAAEQTYRI